MNGDAENEKPPGLVGKASDFPTLAPTGAQTRRMVSF